MNAGTDDTTDTGTPSTPSDVEGLRTVDTEQRRAFIRSAIDDAGTRKVMSMLAACVHCGICADACHFYTSDGDPDLIPANKAEKLSLFLRRSFGPLRPRILRSERRQGIDDAALETLYRAAFENCTTCGRCALACPMGINSGEILLFARAILCRIGKLPSGLTSPVQTACETGNYIGMTREDFVETVEWLAEEMEDDIDEEGLSIPIDRENTEILFVPHPLEVRDWPLLFIDALRILHAAGEDYTLSSHSFDTVNYAYYQGSKRNMMRIAQRMLDAREQLRSKSIVLTPCGHGYRVMRWEVEKVLGRRSAFPVQTLSERIEAYIKSGRLRVRRDALEGPVTYHDPCNIARRGGIVDGPRHILRAISTEYTEMEPHGMHNYCCGGGGGLSSTADFGKIRLTSGKTKAEQIRETGARVVVTNCFNCRTQIRTLNTEYDLNVDVKSIVEVVAASLQ